MKLLRSDTFLSDVQRQADYYCNKAGPELAERYVDAAQATIGLIAQHPKLGPPGRFRHERLRNWRFFLVRALSLSTSFFMNLRKALSLCVV